MIYKHVSFSFCSLFSTFLLHLVKPDMVLLSFILGIFFLQLARAQSPLSSLPGCAVSLEYLPTLGTLSADIQTI